MTCQPINQSTSRLTGHTALITGAGGGLGQAMARAVAQDGAAVALHYRSRREPVEQLAAELAGFGIATAIVQGDLTDPAAPARILKAAAVEIGPVDILINNAGDWIEKPLLDLSVAEWDRMLDTDLRGVFLLCQAVAPAMIAKGWGRMVNISSVASLNYVPGEGVYGIAKAGVNLLTKALGAELAQHHITVNAVAPAWTLPHDEPYPVRREEYPRCAAVPDGRPGHAREVAALVRFLLSDEAAHITGQVLPMDGGLSSTMAKGR